MVYRLILPSWAKDENPSLPSVREGEFSESELAEFNTQGYNVYYLPNYPSKFTPGQTVDGSMIDCFEWAYVDMDLKEGVYGSKDAFITKLAEVAPPPTRIVDSGNGVHVYWAISDLDAMSFLRFQRRLTRLLTTDEAVGKIYQLMRLPGFANTKNPDSLKMCEDLFLDAEVSYTCEQMDKLIPPIRPEDEAYCVQHFNKTYKINTGNTQLKHQVPAKFGELLRSSAEVKELWAGTVGDRSKADFRLGHIMHAHGFSKDEALNVLAYSSKAITRSEHHQISYAQNIIDKIWTFEEEQTTAGLSRSVKDILARSGDTIKGTRFPGPSYLDGTLHGFRLGQVIGLVAGSGVGKTAMALNMFMEFVRNNPDYVHFFVPLEQPANEIADRWRTMCGEDTHLHEKVQVISNYADDGAYRNLSFDEIKAYILKFQEETGKKAGCVVIDHIGALRKNGGKNGEGQALMDICHQMKAFAIHTNTLLVMQSQAPREKAGIGDLELNKDAAYGTVFFESYCDYLLAIWQPLKRCYSEENCPTVTAFKFCKIRHKKTGLDQIHEDVCYKLMFDPKSERMRQLTELEEKAFSFFLQKATNARKQDRKTDIVIYQSTPVTEEQHGTTHNNSHTRAS